MTIKTYNPKVIDALDEYFLLDSFNDYSNIYDCVINIRASGGGYYTFKAKSINKGKYLKKILSKRCKKSDKKIKLYYVCNGSPDVGDLMFSDGRIGKLIVDDQTLFKQNIKPCSFFEMNVAE